MARRNPLSDYNEKRDFSATKEPRGKKARARRKGLSFVVQKHDATRLHYDLRLEWEGVLKSWAVTRGPSLDPSEKRLAVRTEDHPLDYGTFEGTIPKKEYGGGTVMLWDRGTWEPLHDPQEGLNAGKLHFIVHGERMKGGFALVRMRPRKGEKRENWLLIKERDETASETDDLIDRYLTSVSTGRAMDEIAAGEDASEKKAAPKPKAAKRADVLARPRFRKPQLATLVDEAPEGDDWLHEVKFDGYRLLAAFGKGGAALYTRSGLDWTEKFPSVARGIDTLDCRSALIDGEVMAEEISDGGSAFSALQKAIEAGKPMRFYAFDLLQLDGKDLTKLPLVERKEKLRELLARSVDPALQYSEHVTGNGRHVFEEICRAGQEGIVSKRVDQPYREGRGRSWLKVKCTRRQEFIIGGYSVSEKKSRPFASLLMGTMEGDRLVYRGRVGSGFSQDVLEEVAKALKANARKSSAFDSVPREMKRSARWVEPVLVAEVDFAEFTDDGHIRHGVFLGLREDKAAKEVVLEGLGPEEEQMEDAKRSSSRRTGSGEPEVLGVRISSPDRIVFPKQGVTKLDLARYHAVAAERMLAHLAHRPVSLLRCPQGRVKQCFFQKHAGDGFPDAVRRIPITDKSGVSEDYMEIVDAKGLVAAVQMGTMEFHIWGSRTDMLEKPDRLVFDLDPDEGMAFERVKKAAFDTRDKLSSLGLSSLAMVTGGKGIHVIVPLSRRAEWPQAKAFAKALAQDMADAEPERFVATMSKARRKGRIFIDWLRNERGSTAIAPYSTRARENAPVAAPVTWDELADLDAANSFQMHDMLERLEAPDPWKGSEKWRQSLTRKVLDSLNVE
jgi:bifunctional non-homologous end joining protein LigD